MIKKLNWYDNLNVYKDANLVREISEFYLPKRKEPFVSYTLTNFTNPHYPKDMITVFFSEGFVNIGEFRTPIEAKEFCQKHFENYIKELFFDGK